MQSWLMDCLICPECKSARLALVGKSQADFDEASAPRVIVVEGVLECRDCSRRYPVLDESPRMLPASMLSMREKEVLAQSRPKIIEVGAAGSVDGQERENLIRECIFSEYGFPTSGPAFRRAARDFAYQQAYPASRVYQMQLLKTLIPDSPQLILDVGGGSGGNVIAAREVFPFRHAIVADLGQGWPPIYRSGKRDVSYVRADARRLPFRSRGFDLVISSFLIEHVHEWQMVVKEIARLGQHAFIGFGPNRRFPVEVGHLDSPCAHCLPGPLGSLAALGWGWVTGNRRSLRNIKSTLDGMNFISSAQYYLFCRTEGMECTNIFSHVFEAWAAAGNGGVRGMLGRNRYLARSLSRILVSLGMEPNIYSLVRTTSGLDATVPLR